MSKTLKVLPVKRLKQQEKKKLNEYLQQPPFMLSIVAPPRSGKSNLIMNLIYNDNFYRDCFEDIYVFSPTVNLDETLHKLNEDDTVIKITEVKEMDSYIDEIIKQQNEDEDRKDILIVLDDCLGHIGESLTNLSTRYRHYKISIIISIQSFRSIPLIIRNCTSEYIIFKSNNKKELDKYMQELGNGFENFATRYEQATREKYSFVVLDLRKMQMLKSFTKEI